jgi:predicted Zn-dependent protease
MRSSALFVVLALCLTGCVASTAEMLTKVGAGIGQATGVISADSAEAISRNAKVIGESSEKIASTFKDVTPEQEYYLGRAVAATVLSQYQLWDNREATRYINSLGQSLAMFSERPETYSGYRFALLDSEEINAFAAPGGTITLSRGLVRLCENEEELAAVLAHEIAHVEQKHGLRAIKKSRLTSAFTALAMAGAAEAGGGDLRELTSTFGASITDITGTLMNSGYSRDFEFAADRRAIEILSLTGYSPDGLIKVLEKMDSALKPGGLDFAKTHPSPSRRIKKTGRKLTGKTANINQVQAERFAAASRDI